MGSYGKQLLVQTDLTLNYNLQIQWTAKVNTTLSRKWWSHLNSPTQMDSNGLQWAPMERIFLVILLLPSSTITNSNGLQLAPMVNTTVSRKWWPHLHSPTPMGFCDKQLLDQITLAQIINSIVSRICWSYLNFPTPMDSNGLQW